ncbi:MFS transporter [Komagataeibacter rhaeticus]|uniref:Sugar porter family MFS transporter n=1 Tax=Komagataeibacter rhaeticus TaxID=215221 RepID=A0A181C866_9PROT|nr:sugar porter family MFS transporter [Komagataeibacter rhaeticus]MBL7239936.1 sugar porter family MFS transporter [Komagataeibacter rhaeticus]PYD54058.1 MFS transporter [Komagataeibacter rhaeticus]QIP34667.1 sugar porter family MFS transporter [Komagataeibacter rhaeticus]QOC47190.1 sugar porter family MFS transporter [Komagataeibacter rhaeticus]SAY47736.1 Galactose-proton symporter [Komagataeibacter rhaeticus]
MHTQPGGAQTDQSIRHRPVIRGRAGLIGGLAALSGILFGLDTGVMSGALDLIAQEFILSDFQRESLVAIMLLGAALGVLCAAWMSHAWGRKRTLVLTAGLFVIGPLLCAEATSFHMLLFARLLLGLATGATTFTTPLYIAEIADSGRRGAMILGYQLMISCGLLAAFVSDGLFSYFGVWRWMLGIVGFPGLVFMMGVLFLPPSPRWLLAQGRERDARRVLIELRGLPRMVMAERNAIMARLSARRDGIGSFMRDPNCRRAMWLAVGLQVAQQFSGINAVLYYAPHLIGLAGYGHYAQVWGPVGVGVINLLSTCVATTCVDRVGRRPMLVAGFAVMALAMGGQALMVAGGIPVMPGMRLLMGGFMLLFVAAFAFSAGPLAWLLCAEILPLRGREFGMACSTCANWIANMLVSATFLTGLELLGADRVLWIYAGLNALFLLMVVLRVPETRGMTLEQIEAELMRGTPLRTLGGQGHS